ncbi:IS1-like element transposase, partial [Escherichia coli]
GINTVIRTLKNSRHSE